MHLPLDITFWFVVQWHKMSEQEKEWHRRGPPPCPKNRWSRKEKKEWKRQERHRQRCQERALERKRREEEAQQGEAKPEPKWEDWRFKWDLEYKWEHDLDKVDVKFEHKDVKLEPMERAVSEEVEQPIFIE
jgi:hypothetical protein